MPCPWSRRARCAGAEHMATLPSPTSSPDVVEWWVIRRQHMRELRKQTRHALFLLALMESLKIGPIQLVYAGRDGYPAAGEQDFGLVHTVAYVISYIYLCLFMIVFVPLFSWWVPNTAASDPDHPSTMMRIADYLKQINMISLPVCAGIAGLSYIYHLIVTFIYVDACTKGSRKLPKNSKKNWLVRLFLLLGIAITVSLGYGALQILASVELAHVKPLEYAAIILPININMGIMLGSAMQFKMEKRMAMRETARRNVVDVEREEVIAVVEEKQALIDV